MTKNERNSITYGIVIAVVDDDESIRAATARLLRSCDFKVDAFPTAESFLKSGRLHHTSCLVLDLSLPGMSGLELQTYLSELGHRIPIIFITGSRDGNKIAQAMNAGAIAYLHKPFSDQALLNAVRAALNTGSGGHPGSE